MNNKPSLQKSCICSTGLESDRIVPSSIRKNYLQIFLKKSVQRSGYATKFQLTQTNLDFFTCSHTNKV